MCFLQYAGTQMLINVSQEAQTNIQINNAEEPNGQECCYIKESWISLGSWMQKSTPVYPLQQYYVCGEERRGGLASGKHRCLSNAKQPWHYKYTNTKHQGQGE